MAYDFPTQIKAHFIQIQGKIGEDLSHRVYSETRDGDGNLTSSSWAAAVTIAGIVVPIEDENDEILEEGRYVLGDAQGYFKITDGVNEKDIIISVRGIRYQVSEIRSRGQVSGITTVTHVLLKRRPSDFGD